jgi:hypothetical protein
MKTFAQVLGVFLGCVVFVAAIIAIVQPQPPRPPTQAELAERAERAARANAVKDAEIIAFATSAVAQSASMAGLDFMVDWPELNLQTVTIVDGHVVNASHDYAQLRVTGGTVSLFEPWIEREDLRYVLRHCTSVFLFRREKHASEPCRMAVTGTVIEGRSGGPALTRVKFHVPN